MKLLIPLIAAVFISVMLSSCSSDETVTVSTADTLSYGFNNLNDSVITINYAVGGKTSSQPVIWTVNLNKSILQMRHNMTYFNGGTMTVNLYRNDTVKVFSFPLGAAADTLRPSIPGPANRVELVPTNFKGRGTVTIAK